MGNAATQRETDIAIVAELRAGKEAGFDRAYQRYRSRIFGFLVRMTRSRETAEDLLQETWIRLAKNARRLRESTNLRAWLFTVARNLARSHARSSRGAALELDEGDLVEHATPYVLTDVSERCAQLDAALARLSPSHREVLLLVGHEQMSPAEASIVLGESQPATRKRLSRARASLRKELES